MDEDKTRGELERIRRVSDQLCTAHAALSQRYGRRSLILDIALLTLTAWLTAMAFVDPLIATYLTPPFLKPTIWIGLLSVGAFVVGLYQLRADWKGLSEAHRRSLAMYSEVKREAGYLLASSPDKISQREFLRLASRYDMASDVGVGVPEGEFLRQKKRHKIKVELSKLLDERPGALLPVERVKVLLRDMRAVKK